MVSKKRLTRISERIREELSEILLMESSDPRLKGISITDVEVDRELAFADIYVCSIDGFPRSHEILTALDHAHGFLRSELAHRIDLRTYPRLRFYWDPTFEHADKIEQLIKSIHQTDPGDKRNKKIKRKQKTMDQNHELIATIHGQLEKVNRILVLSHLRPDGDAIGSLLGIGLALLDTGKDVQMVLSDGVPDNFTFLTGSELIKNKPTDSIDYIIVVDSAEIERTDTVLDGYGTPDLNIDHHKTNTNFAKINLVESEAVATAELLAEFVPELGLKISKPVANALLAGIVTDTIGFRTTNVNPHTLRITADLMESGGDLTDIYFRTIVEQSYSSAKYWGAGLSKIQMEDGLVWTTLSLVDRKIAGYKYQDDADLVKIISAIEGAKIAVILTEQVGGYVKISWRLCGSLQTEMDVSEIAQKYGGGGHKAAAGADTKGNIDEVLADVLENTRSLMSEYKKI